MLCVCFDVFCFVAFFCFYEYTYDHDSKSIAGVLMGRGASGASYYCTSLKCVPRSRPKKKWKKRLSTLGCPGPHPSPLSDYVAGYDNPLLFLFEQTYNYYVDNQPEGLLPWWLQRLCGRVQSSFGLIVTLIALSSRHVCVRPQAGDGLNCVVCCPSINQSILSSSDILYQSPLVSKPKPIRNTNRDNWRWKDRDSRQNKTVSWVLSD